MFDQKSVTLLLAASLVISVSYFIHSYNMCYKIDDNSSVIRIIQKREIKETIYNYKGTEAFLINTPGCYIPNYSKKIKFKEAAYKKISCGQRAIFISKIYDSWQKIMLVLKIDKEKMRYYIKDNQKYACCYSFGVQTNETGRKKSRISYDKCKIFESGSKVDLTQEVMLVKCFTLTIKTNRKRPSILYEDAFVFVKKQPRKSMKYNDKTWNVLIIGIDTMSRARIYTVMPNMVKYLQAQGWLDYKGYQKIGYNTFPNLMAVLTGKNVTTVDQACSLGMDTCNDLMAWSTFRKSGYITAFGEDNLGLPDTFSRHRAFKTAPTHHYMRPFFLTGESQIGNYICVKHQPSAKHILDYAYDFATMYIKEKFFGTFWINTFSHNTDYLPSLFENDTIHFFEKLSSTGIMDNTFIMLLSDHGIRYGSSRLEMESYYEERLPMLFVWVPIEFRNMHEEKFYNLQLNQNRLVTPYDIYATLVKISNMPKRSTDFTSESCPLCSSIFEEKSSSRTCAEAGVSEKWCSCHNMRNSDTFMDIDAVNSIQLAVSYLQNYTLHIKTVACMACHPLRLDTVFRIHSYINQNNKKNYVIAFQMVADDHTGRGIPVTMSYEATVLKDNNKLTVLDPIDTITAYNARGHCTKKQTDRCYCICKAVNCYTFK